MPVDCFFLDQPLQKGATLSLGPEEVRHLIKVLRHQEGDSILLLNGRNQKAEARIQKIHKDSVTILIESVEEKASPAHKLILCQALPQHPSHLDFILEKGTELGMHEIWLFPGERSPKKNFSDSQQRRAEALFISAMKQSGRWDLPKLVLKPALKEWKNEDFAGQCYFGDLSLNAPWLKDVFKPNQLLKVFIGPESGLSSVEMRFLQAKGVQGVRLHENILRTETAALCALSLVSHLMR